MEHYYEACHALAESLYQLKRYDTAKVFYQRVYAARTGHPFTSR